MYLDTPVCVRILLVSENLDVRAQIKRTAKKKKSSICRLPKSNIVNLILKRPKHAFNFMFKGQIKLSSVQ